MITDENLARLPRWAQNEILRLRSELTAAKRDLAGLAGQHVTPVEISAFAQPLGYVDPSNRIRFWFSRDRHLWIDAGLRGLADDDPRDEDRRVEITGAYVVEVEPRASNSLYIRLRDRR